MKTHQIEVVKFYIIHKATIKVRDVYVYVLCSSYWEHFCQYIFYFYILQGSYSVLTHCELLQYIALSGTFMHMLRMLSLNPIFSQKYV